jgi:hypothetical protein
MQIRLVDDKNDEHWTKTISLNMQNSRNELYN